MKAGYEKHHHWRMDMNDVEFMKQALEQARAAYQRGECPVGAVLIRGDQILARAGNRECELNDPTAHAEILVLREAGRVLGQHTLEGCTVYTTLWPCPMCENALLRAKINNVVCGAHSFRYIQDVTFNRSNLSKIGPVMSEDCREIFIRWLKATGRTFILEYEASDQHTTATTVGSTGPRAVGNVPFSGERISTKSE